MCDQALSSSFQFQVSSIQSPVSSIPSRIVFQDTVHLYHPQDEAQNQGGTDKDDQVGCKKGHNKGVRVFQLIRSDQDMDAECQEKTACKNEKNLAKPPENAVHEKHPGSGVKDSKVIIVLICVRQESLT
jgi:hypothetical protein